MFIEQGIKKENEFWKYLIGSLIIFLASLIGQIPWAIAVFVKAFNTGVLPSSTEEMLVYLEPNSSLFFMMLSFVFAIMGIYYVVKRFHNQSFLSIITSRKKIDWNRVLLSFAIWALFSIATILITYYSSPDELVWNFKPVPFAILVIIGTLLIPIQTSTEELVFRGYLMQGFANLAKNKWFPLLMTSLIFGSMHVFNPEVNKMGYIILVYYIGTGLFLGVITLMDEGMELSLGFHAANNLIGALLVTSDWSVFQTYSIFKDVSTPTAGFDVLLPVFIIYPILLFIFSKKYKWNNWKEKLTGNIIENNLITEDHE